MSVTGVLLTYERQMIASAERGPFAIESANRGVNALPIEDLLAKAEVKQAATVSVRSDVSEPVELNFGPKGIQYLNPYTGRILGSPGKGSREFFQKVRAWHRWISFEGEWRAWGKAITGACTLAFLGLVLSGLYLWVPQVWSWRHVRPISWFRGGLSGKARDFNWHNAIGIWSAVPLFFVIVTALPISYQWANQLIYTVTGTTIPKVENAPPMKGDPNPSGLNRMMAEAMRQPDWQTISFRYGAGDGPVVFNVDRGIGVPVQRVTLSLDRATGVVVKRESFEDFNTGRQVRMYSRFLHTGEVLGLPGQTVAGIASAGGVVLVWTGLALAWRRFNLWRHRTGNAQEVVEPQPETVST